MANQDALYLDHSDCNKGAGTWARVSPWESVPIQVDSCKKMKLEAVGGHQAERACLRIKPAHSKKEREGTGCHIV